MKILIIEPLEPLALSGAPITGMRYFSYTKVYPIPLPTTIVGALGAALGIHIANAKDSMNALSKLVNELMSRYWCSRPILEGPVVQFRELTKIYIPVGNVFIPMNIDTKILNVLQRSRSELYIDPDACRYAPCVELEPEVRIGIALERRGASGEKRVLMGHTYRYGVAEYRTFDGKPVTPLFIYKLNCENVNLGDVVIRIGGEHRAAKMVVREDEKLIKIFEKRICTPLNLRGSGTYIAINYVPLIPKSGDVLELDPQRLIGLEFVSKADDVKGMISFKGKIPATKVERLGLGYSEVVQARRPQILALPPGTIFKITSITQNSVSNTIGILWSIGFASLFKLE